jgi:predicted transposase YbfD/YdcC
VAVAAPIDWSARQEWAGIQSIAMVVRESTDHTSQQTSGDVRYFISSLPPRARSISKIVRQHWGIENGLHWVLDVAFNEDRLRLRDRTAVNNMALLNRLAVSVLKQDRSIKAGVKCKRKAAGWNTAYLAKLLGLRS